MKIIINIHIIFKFYDLKSLSIFITLTKIKCKNYGISFKEVWMYNSKTVLKIFLEPDINSMPSMNNQ
jgi:hypothetical protein